MLSHMLIQNTIIVGQLIIRRTVSHEACLLACVDGSGHVGRNPPCSLALVFGLRPVGSGDVRCAMLVDV